MAASNGPGTPSSIPWHRRLEAQVLLGVLVVAGLSLSAVAVITGRVVRSHTFARARTDLTAARAAFDGLITTRADHAQAQTRLITALPVFRAHMTDAQLSSDAATMEVMADAYRRELSAAFCVVTAADGRWLASPGASEESAAALNPVIRSAVGGRSGRRIIALQGVLFLVIAEPALFAGEVLGTLTSAYRLDDAVAAELTRVTRQHVTLVSDEAVSGTSFEAERRDALSGLVRAIGASPDGAVALWHVGTDAHIGAAFPLGSGTIPSSSGRLILLEPWAPTQAFIDDIVWQLTWAGLGVFVVAVVGGVVISRRMTRPLRDVADLAREIAGGRWDRSVPVRGNAEAAAVAEALNDMTRGLRHWRDQALQRTQELESAYRRYAAVVNSVPDAIVSTDGHGDVTFWNRGAESILACAEARAIGMPMLSLIAPGSREAWSDAVRAAMAHEGTTQSFEGEGLRGHQTFPFECAMASWRDGGQTRVTAIIRDVTERRRAHEALQQRDAQLRQAQKMEALGRVASSVAHDFNNVLAVIQGYTEQILLSVGEGTEHYDDLSEVLKASQSAGSLTRQLLAFSRKQAIEPQVLSLSEVITNVERMLRRLVGTQVELTTSFDPSAADSVFADRGQLEQIVVNLCVNARDAMPDGGRLAISVGRSAVQRTDGGDRPAAPPDDYVTLAVSDSGHGMDAATAAQIFEPFFTTKEPGKGTGLGLSTVYGIVRQSGGTIELTTKPGKGTTFFIHWPSAGADRNALEVGNLQSADAA